MGYVIFYTTDSSQRDRDWVVEGVVGDKMTTTIKSLAPDTAYFIQIQDRYNKDYGPFSNVIQFRTNPSKFPSLFIHFISRAFKIIFKRLFLLLQRSSGSLNTVVSRRLQDLDRSSRNYELLHGFWFGLNDLCVYSYFII